MQSKQTNRPKRVQRKRTKGYRIPPNTVYVGRPSKWGNPFIIHKHGPLQPSTRVWAQEHFGSLRPSRYVAITPHLAVDLYIEFVAPKIDFTPLRGKNVCCWCAPGEPCHGDVILERANQ